MRRAALFKSCTGTQVMADNPVQRGAAKKSRYNMEMGSPNDAQSRIPNQQSNY
jgi:hypothetical protein